MTKGILLVIACLALCACAASNAVDEQLALSSCQAVGISRQDPQFATCMQAQIQARRETQLEHAYDDAKHFAPAERMTRHADEIF